MSIIYARIRRTRGNFRVHHRPWFIIFPNNMLNALLAESYFFVILEDFLIPLNLIVSQT